MLERWRLSELKSKKSVRMPKSDRRKSERRSRRDDNHGSMATRLMLKVYDIVGYRSSGQHTARWLLQLN